MIKIFITLFGLILPFYLFLSCSGEVVYNHSSNIEELGHGYYFLGDGHLLLGLIREGDGMAIKILKSHWMYP